MIPLWIVLIEVLKSSYYPNSRNICNYRYNRGFFEDDDLSEHCESLREVVKTKLAELVANKSEYSDNYILSFYTHEYSQITDTLEEIVMRMQKEKEF
jgi:hypothetical protein